MCYRSEAWRRKSLATCNLRADALMLNILRDSTFGFPAMSASSRLLAKMCCPSLGSQKLSSHTLKTTLFTWRARFGVKSSVRSIVTRSRAPSCESRKDPWFCW
eukprot:3766219-Amphidinium_carterae.1